MLKELFFILDDINDALILSLNYLDGFNTINIKTINNKVYYHFIINDNLNTLSYYIDELDKLLSLNHLNNDIYMKDNETSKLILKRSNKRRKIN